MAHAYSTFQKHTREQSLTVSPLTQPSMQGYVHAVSIVTVKEPQGSKSIRELQTVHLDIDDVIALRDSLIKNYPVTEDLNESNL